MLQTFLVNSMKSKELSSFWDSFKKTISHGVFPEEVVNSEALSAAENMQKPSLL